MAITECAVEDCHQDHVRGSQWCRLHRDSVLCVLCGSRSALRWIGWAWLCDGCDDKWGGDEG